MVSCQVDETSLALLDWVEMGLSSQQITASLGFRGKSDLTNLMGFIGNDR